MNALDIIRKAHADGVTIELTPAGEIKATGNGEAVRRWQPVIRERKAEIAAVLAELTRLVETCAAAYKFTPAELDEALRAALRNPIGARACFLAVAGEIAAERPPTLMRGEVEP
jgi:hypothetical protein